MYIIIGVWGGPNRVYAAFKFFLYTLLGSPGFLPHSDSYGAANPTKTVLAGAKLRFDAPSPTGS